ncbi:hypothetical protein HMPREF0290_0531, partial [Corynebacterium efficiens YS-314]
KVRVARATADRAGGARLTLINLGALLTLLDVTGPARSAGLILIGLGLIGHVITITRAIITQYRMEN